MRKKVTFQIEMTIRCREYKTCTFKRDTVKRFGVDGDLVCLDCILDDHMEGYPEGKVRGVLKIETAK